MKLSDIRTALGLPPGADDGEIAGVCDLSSAGNNCVEWLSWIADRNVETVKAGMRQTLICSTAAAEHAQRVKDLPDGYLVSGNSLRSVRR